VVRTVSRRRPVLEEIALERDDLRIVKLNVDENQVTAAQFQVLSIPTLILFKDGAEAKKVIGAYPKKRLEAELEPVLAYRLTVTGARSRAYPEPGCAGAAASGCSPLMPASTSQRPARVVQARRTSQPRAIAVRTGDTSVE
jgi:thioredoxin-like negative regulator of GroEL